MAKRVFYLEQKENDSFLSGLGRSQAVASGGSREDPPRRFNMLRSSRSRRLKEGGTEYFCKKKKNYKKGLGTLTKFLFPI